MPQSEETPPPAFSVGVNESGVLAAGAQYAIYAEIGSEDRTVRVSETQDAEWRAYYDIGISVSASVSDDPYDAMLQFKAPENPEEAGHHILKWVSPRRGLLAVGNRLFQVVDFIEEGVLLGYENGCGWSSASSVDSAFGWHRVTGWRWFGIQEIDDPCKNTNDGGEA